MNSIRKKRIYSILFVLFFSVSGVSLILYSLNSNLDYFFTPTELQNQEIPADKRIKVGGMVLEGSIKRESSDIYFVVTDYENSINVVYEGIVPDLFKEDSGVVVLGFLDGETFIAEEVLAKHDENYMPPSIKINNDS
ncbi:MAG: cytochrome c maturation protein CcmE [Gammaproteobacteria bacterium]|nr:cytochrome c maturation protein CcmE [Gammaproteobacteria bacterium]|tara:strand:- start:13 stop:423 length:411 start_codon:yes stop_codon:yes gene_type:complete